MVVIRPSLFWKIYFTLLGSLVVVAVLMGTIWWLLGETPRERWDAFRNRLAEEVERQPNEKPELLAATIGRLGEEMGADVSVYDKSGSLLAAHGRWVRVPLAAPAEGEAAGPRPAWHRFLRLDLTDGRVVLARLRQPPGEPARLISTAVIVVVGGVALAAFPMTALLTRRLERLRAGMAAWGAGALATRVDSCGNDEVALVARSFNAAAERLEHLLAAQKALLANASHELRSPLGRLRLAIELLTTERSAATEAEIIRNLGEIDGLVEEILLSSRLDHMAPDHMAMGLDEVEIVDLMGLAAEEAARVEASADGPSIEIAGNSALLRRMLRNLLENAVKHGKPPVQVAVSRSGEEVRIVVSDRGPGIGAEDRLRVFEPFYRPAGRSEATGGWGLGLALVRQIASRHGGSVECEEAEGGGSRFVVRLMPTLRGGVPSGARGFSPVVKTLALSRPSPQPVRSSSG